MVQLMVHVVLQYLIVLLKHGRQICMPSLFSHACSGRAASAHVRPMPNCHACKQLWHCLMPDQIPLQGRHWQVAVTRSSSRFPPTCSKVSLGSGPTHELYLVQLQLKLRALQGCRASDRQKYGGTQYIRLVLHAGSELPPPT